MKILLVSPKMKVSNGGIATWTNIYLDSCEAAGINPAVLNTEPVGARAKNGNARRCFTDEFVRTRRIFKNLRCLLKSDRYAVAHINTSCGKFGLVRDYMVAKRIKKKQPQTKIVLHFHCDIPYQVKDNASKKHLMKLLKVGDKNLVLCENSRKYLLDNFGYESTKVPNFVDGEMIKERATRDTVEKLFFVGRVSAAKGAKEIYELARKNPEMTFELAGNVSEQVAGWEKPQNVKLLGQLTHDEVLQKMDEADVFLFPTHSEGFSLALAEAMSRGLPAITTDVGANMDMLEDKGGIVVAVGDVDAMHEAIGRLCDRALRDDMSKWSVAKVREHYVTETVMSSFAEIYRNL